MTHSVTLAQNVIWFSLKRETEIFYWFSSCYKSQFLQTLIPVWCTLWTFKERWSMKKGAKFTQWINSSIQAHIHRKSFAIFTIFFNDMGQSHTYGWYYKILDCKGEALFSTLLMKNAERSLVAGRGGIREFQWIKKRHFVPDSSIPSASYLEHLVFPALTHSPLCLQAGEAASPPRRDGRWRDTQQKRRGGGGGRSREHSKLACLV